MTREQLRLREFGDRLAKAMLTSRACTSSKSFAFSHSDAEELLGTIDAVLSLSLASQSDIDSRRKELDDLAAELASDRADLEEQKSLIITV